MTDRPVGGRYMAFNNANHGVRWYDVVAGRETQETVRNFTYPLKPVAAGAWSFSGNPGLAAFHGGRVVIPCGYEGLLLQRQGN